MSYYIHDIPGRLRIKSPILRKNKLAATAAELLMAATNGVKTVGVNLLTGSLLINYNPAVTKHHELVGVLQDNGYFDHSKAITNDQYIHGAASKFSEFAIDMITTFV
jgi:hypothetical protein